MNTKLQKILIANLMIIYIYTIVKLSLCEPKQQN